MINSHPPSPYVFVAGCPRSGTTLLQRMLDHHPALAVANDTHFIPRALQRGAPDQIRSALQGRSVPLDEGLVDALLGYRRLPRLGIATDQIRDLASEAGDYATWVRGIYTLFAASRNKVLAGEKTPDYVRHLPLLHGLFPSARSLHIVRDGRDVALSALDWAGPKKGPGRWDLWRADSVGAAALWWRHQVQTGLDDASVVPHGRHRLIRYEDLVIDPEGHLRQIAQFLGLEYADSMLRFHIGRQTSDPGRSAKANWLPPTSGLRDWRTQMTIEDVAVFEQITGSTLEACGYERVTYSRADVVTRRRALACEGWWKRYSALRQRKERRRLGGDR